MRRWARWRTAASDSPTSAAIAVYDIRPSFWSSAIIFLDLSSRWTGLVTGSVWTIRALPARRRPSVSCPRGTWHNVTNIGGEPVRLYTVYPPVHPAPDKVHATAHDEESGNDEPPGWSVQPPQQLSDEHF